ncbi:MAG: dihydrofolate reductase family protein [Mycobacteriales bacterium]|jgi:dihydrofolate reductase
MAAMGMVYADLSVSLDGYIAGARVGVDNPMGDGGEHLHEWMFAGKSPEESRAFEEEHFATTGALLMGRTMADVGMRFWGEDPTFHAPVFVVTHRAAGPVVKAGGTTYTFVTDGPAVAFEAARAAAGNHDLCVAGGASVVQWTLDAGVLDELRLHLVPVLLGDGVRLFAPGQGPAALVPRGAAEQVGVVHLRYGLH